MAAYAFCIAHKRPGNFYLAYKFNINDRPKHEVSFYYYYYIIIIIIIIL